jgi:uncharacterized protein with HEPN domain
MRHRYHPDSPTKTDIRCALESILTAGGLLVSWTKDVNEHRFWADKLKRAAVERQFEVIAEALSRLRDLDPRIWRSIEDADTAIRLGDAIRRDYDDIEYGILWRATRNELPQMLREVDDLLASLASK